MKFKVNKKRIIKFYHCELTRTKTPRGKAASFIPRLGTGKIKKPVTVYQKNQINYLHSLCPSFAGKHFLQQEKKAIARLNANEHAAKAKLLAFFWRKPIGALGKDW